MPPNETDTSIDFLEVEKLLETYLPSNKSGGGETWYPLCVEEVKNAWDSDPDDNKSTRTNIRNGLVMNIDGELFAHNGQNGKINEAWGISLDLCNTHCGPKQLPMVTSFNRFAAGSTSYLLPWLALTAQLPYETGSAGADIMSVCIGLGSPMLMTVSLMMTILNKRWIRKKFRYTLSMPAAQRSPTADMVKRAQAALVIAENAQQVPVRLDQSQGWLARQIVLDTYTPWWEEAAKSLGSTRRRVTLSLVAQLSVAVISWILTVVGSLMKNVGNTEEALALSSGSLWIWLVPVIVGWITVGTQNKADTIKAAIGNTSSGREVPGGINVATDDFVADPSSVCVNEPESAKRAWTRVESRQKLWNVGVCGYQKQQGPAFNFARALTSINFADRLHMAFDTAIYTCGTASDGDEHLPLAPDEEAKRELVSKACGLFPDTCTHGKRSPTSGRNTVSSPLRAEPVPRHDLREFPSLSEVSPDARSAFWKHLAFSMLMGVVIQWGTTSLAFAMAFETVVKGLGCRSGSYLLYGAVSTMACLSMLLSAALSHVTMRGYERGGQATPLVGALAVVTLLLGRCLLVANTAWLLLISIWELIGFFDSCYCASTELSKGHRGWVLLFKSADALKKDAQSAWAACIVVGFVIVLLSIAIFSLATRKQKEQ
ncbi:hypothetical protein CMUS01_12515 [Colletotrichum musicola]|uniref:Uncharacterized protein n=1 Tax=Colletotrichum musicola TaxID=2175873 RepID=A0A8H6MZS6_9PEZI|nr:hypothetical protein CMUS01_12515 [Colletotrichum musicola]